MFDWIIVDVIGVPRKVRFVADRVFPKAALPQLVFPFLIARDGKTASDDFLRVNKLLMRRHRPGKSESSGGSVSMA